MNRKILVPYRNCAGSVVAQAIGPWKESRPPVPPKGFARINLLVPSGLHFGQGPLDSLAMDRLAGPVIASAFRPMQELIKLTKVVAYLHRHIMGMVVGETSLL